MRRVEPDIYGSRKVPPFRVLGTGCPPYAPACPPPPSAPEPYKIAPASSSSTRSHRRSSFVIIAEARPATPNSRSPSPSLATGRVSPFRGRGFRGPLPHGQSRPQTPENQDGRRYSRNDRRASISQQNSPKRSLIPQPTRRRSISLTKPESGRASPKYGRRAVSKNHLEVTTNIAPGRRASLRPGLSPIQGTPTKPPEKKNGPPGRDKPRDKKSSPVKSRRNSTLPPKSVSKSRRPSREKSPAKEAPTSPSKIPVKRGSISNKTGSKPSQTARRNSVSKFVKPGEKTERNSNDKSHRKTESKIHSNKNSETLDHHSAKTDQNVNTESNPSDQIPKEETKSVKSKDDDGPSLLDLLKQSSGASGTSSMVNTTTFTAAQPLHIDALALLDNETSKEKNGQPKQRNTESGKKSGQSRSTAGQANNSNGNENHTRNVQNPKGEKDDTSKTTNEGKIDSSNGSGNQNPSSTKIGHSKTGSSGQSVKNSSKTSSANGDNGQANQSIGIIRGQNSVVNGQTATAQSNDQRSTANGPSNINVQSIQNINANTQKNGAQNNTQYPAGGVLERSGDNQALAGVSSKQPVGVQSRTNVTGGSTGHNKVDGKGGDAKTTNESDAKKFANSGTTVNTTKAVASAVNGVRVNGDGNVLSQGSGNVSMKSSTGVSTGSVGSFRSTDTGVSVNTVRGGGGGGGVSSAREKRGTHLVKRPQEIETLSGNVVHLEQNGEPAVLASDHSEDHDAEKLSCWKKLVGRCRSCGPAMRCLACRRGPKGQSWPARDPIPPAVNETTPTSGCWSKLKAACRCCCCPRGARVAPAEGNVCCPPERRCGTLCRRLFARCRCRSPEAQRTLSIRAKQSLTSVAAPPLSEERKEKIPEVLVEHNSLMRGAIPCLPVPLAWFCLVWNVLLPGTGTFWSGLFNLCVGQPRFSAVASPRARFGAFIVNLVVGVGQLFTVLFCLVGWGWSIWWGVTMVRLARKYKRFRDSEAASSDAEARVGDPTSLPPGVPSQALRGIERAR